MKEIILWYKGQSVEVRYTKKNCFKYQMEFFTGESQRLMADTFNIQDVYDKLAQSRLEHLAEISLRNKSENLLKDLLREQKKMTAHFMAIREEERKSVAREIQEDLGQMLASMQLNLSLMTLESHDQTQIAVRTKELEQLISSSISAVQRISSQLRPVMLDQLGLAEAIEWQLQEFMKSSGIPCKGIILLKEKSVHIEVATAIYRVLQEALVNIFNCSGATDIQVTLLERSGFLTLSVCDNGSGLSGNIISEERSLSIARMREWAMVFGGKLRICSTSSNGNALLARIPINRQGG